MSFKNIYNYVSYLAIVLLINACGTPVTDSDELDGEDSATLVQKAKNDKIQKIFSTIPAQQETMAMLDEAEARYSSKFLNPIENVAKYSSVKSRALNLGIYGIDLGVTNIFDQTQESMLYLRCTNKMATSLGISGAFDEKMSERIDASSDSKDSLLVIITDSYRNADNYLQENGQPGVSSLMVVGGWIEGMYVATQIASASSTAQTIIDKVSSEKATLENLISLLVDYKAENEGTEDILESLNQLKAIYDTASPKLTPEQFKQIADKVAEIRNGIIQQTS